MVAETSVLKPNAASFQKEPAILKAPSGSGAEGRGSGQARHATEARRTGQGHATESRPTEARPTEAQLAPEEVERLRPRLVPSERNRQIYREVKILNRTEREVADKFLLSQPRVHAICKQVKRWLKSGGADLDGLSPEEKLNLCTNQARIRLSLAYSAAVRLLEASGAEQLSERKIIKDGKEERVEVVRKGANLKPAFLGHMLKAAIELARIEGVYDQSPKSKVGARGAMTNDQAPMTKATPPEGALSGSDRKDASDQTYGMDPEYVKELRADGCSEKTIARVAHDKRLEEKGRRYQALATACGLAPSDRELFQDVLTDLETAAENADAYARERLAAEGLASGANAAGASAAGAADGRLAQYRVQFLKNLLVSDFDFVDDAYRAVLSRYEPTTGRFDWWRQEAAGNLATIVLEPEYEEDEEDEEE